MSDTPAAKLVKKSDADSSYNPFEYRNVQHPTSDLGAFMHLLKGSLGTGILAMPMAFMHAGLWFGLIATLIVGIVCTYCEYILVNCSHTLCKRAKIPSMTFPDIAEQAFLLGPIKLQKYSNFFRFLANLLLIVYLIGVCSIYIIFVSKNLQQIVHFYTEKHMTIRLYILIIIVPLLFMSLIRNLKYLIPFSLIANFLLIIGLCITMYFIMLDLPNFSERPGIVPIVHWPIFFGTVIFAMEGIGVVMSIENDMKKPQHFISCPGILSTAMTILITMYTFVGFFGYLKYGEITASCITLNIPVKQGLARFVKLIIALAIFFSYNLQLYVPRLIIWNCIKHKFSSDNHTYAEYGVCILLVISTFIVAVICPNLAPLISVVGAVCLSQLGIVFPAILDVIVHIEESGMGRLYWRLWINSFLVLFGIMACMSGAYVSLLDFYNSVLDNIYGR